ncbi:PKD domain-containing protein [Desulfosediminicola flagellatus]|uniref:PKD domain-containing protein n=1 Tax=Desulfosediminicola flagellatus TaxID=2569541 RepID=UPI0010ABAE94|nr:PKD domain-containing protein [Desulfosediminicola flagellatus]
MEQRHYLPNNTETKSMKLSLALTVAFVMLSSPLSNAASQFEGSTPSVSITDAASTNAPPIAVLTYTQSGDTFTFDASGSTDPDGSITEYKWDFSDGDSGSGTSISHQYTPPYDSLAVTLTVRDTNGGVGITQARLSVPSPPPTINDVRGN